MEKVVYFSPEAQRVARIGRSMSLAIFVAVGFGLVHAERLYAHEVELQTASLIAAKVSR